MTLKQWLLLQNLLAQSSEIVDAQNNTQIEDTTSSSIGTTSAVNEGDKLFTQDEVNKVVQKRVKEVKKQFEDYNDLKTQVEQLNDQLKLIKKQ
jgi:hypothetical protein